MSAAGSRAIPLDWVRRYIDAMIGAARGLDEGSPMQRATLLRIEHVMDMTQAWKEGKR